MSRSRDSGQGSALRPAVHSRLRTAWILLLPVWLVVAQGAPILDFHAFGDCNLSLVDTQITDQGDGDGFADTNETLQIGISLVPICECASKWTTSTRILHC